MRRRVAFTLTVGPIPLERWLYASTGRPSIPPARLLKASLLSALYSVRSDRMFCEMLDDNILFRWFLDMSLDERGLDQSSFSRLHTGLTGEETARRVVRQARAASTSLGDPEHLAH